MTFRDDVAMDRARKRVRALRQFYGHLTVYVAVNILLVVIDIVNGTSGSTFLGLDWAYWPILGWGIAIALQAVSVIFPTGRWEERKTKEVYEKQREHHLSDR